MSIIKKENRLCLSCMGIHDVEIVEVNEKNIFKNEPVEYPAIYEHCSNTDEYTENEEFIKKNDLSFKDAYRKKMHLLTSNEIISIRQKYGVSQKDFSEILGWGRATIIRYENHQVQDEAHDEILRKINDDPKWFIELLKKNSNSISKKSYLKYLKNAEEINSSKDNDYLCEAIYAKYLKFLGDDEITGGYSLNLEKVVEVINYLAMNVEALYKVKLMKMLWYSDFLNYKRYGTSITGLAYNALKMGAVPECYDHILLLNNVLYETIPYEDKLSYKFMPYPDFCINLLNDKEIKTIDDVIRITGFMKTEDLVKLMHEETAYKCTFPNDKISYKYARELSID